MTERGVMEWDENEVTKWVEKQDFLRPFVSRFVGFDGEALVSLQEVVGTKFFPLIYHLPFQNAPLQDIIELLQVPLCVALKLIQRLKTSVHSLKVVT